MSLLPEGETLYLQLDSPTLKVRDIGKFCFDRGPADDELRALGYGQAARPIFMVWATKRWYWRQQNAWGLTWGMLCEARGEGIDWFYMWRKDMERTDDKTAGSTWRVHMGVVLSMGLAGVPDDWGQDVGIEEDYWDYVCNGCYWTKRAEPRRRIPTLYIPEGVLGDDIDGPLPAYTTATGAAKPPPPKVERPPTIDPAAPRQLSFLDDDSLDN